MRLYLVQHGEAWSKEHDPERSLSEGGTDAVNEMANFLKHNDDLKVSNIFHSGKLRARQTADILSGAVESANGTGEAEGLKPMDDPAIWANKLRDMNDDVMLVGHLPHLSKLAGLLITGDAEREPIRFHNGGMICVQRIEDNNWIIEWIVVPEILN